LLSESRREKKSLVEHTDSMQAVYWWRKQWQNCSYDRLRRSRAARANNILAERQILRKTQNQLHRTRVISADFNTTVDTFAAREHAFASSAYQPPSAESVQLHRRGDGAKMRMLVCKAADKCGKTTHHDPRRQSREPDYRCVSSSKGSHDFSHIRWKQANTEKKPYKQPLLVAASGLPGHCRSSNCRSRPQLMDMSTSAPAAGKIYTFCNIAPNSPTPFVSSTLHRSRRKTF